MPYKSLYTSLLIVLTVILVACSSKSDEQYRAEENEKLQEFLVRDEVLYYKGLKTFARLSLAQNQNRTIPYQSEFSELETRHITAISQELTPPYDSARKIDLVQEAVVYYKAYQEYKLIKELLIKVDEDSLPSFCELLLNINASAGKSFFDGQDIQTIEHLLFGITIYTPQKLPQSLVLYELDRVDMDRLGTTDVRAIAQSIRGLLLSQYKFVYLSEWEHTENLHVLENSPFVPVFISPVVPYKETVKLTPQERSRLELHSVNLIGRALARMGMDRDDKKELAIKDFEYFLEDAEKLGWDNELVWLCGAYVALTNEDQENALRYLGKLQKSAYMQDKESQMVLAESIQYLEKRDPEKAFVRISDKTFIARLSLSLTLAAIEKTGVADKLYASGDQKLKDFSDKLTKQSELIRKIFKADQLFEEGDKLMDKAKDLF